MFRLNLRTRLTLLYGGMFFAAGALLVAVNYAVVRQSLAEKRFQVRVAAPSPEALPAPGAVPAPVAGDVVVADQGTAAQIIAREEATRQAVLDQLLSQSVLTLVLVGVAALAAGWAIALHALRPVHEITATARRVAGSRLDERIALVGPDDEVKELADTVDAMLDRLAGAFAAQRRFVAHASHELRTPLALGRTLTEVAMDAPDASPDLRRVGALLLDVHGRTERMLAGLLALARSENALTDSAPVDLAAVCEHAADELETEYADAGVTLTQRLDTVLVLGSATLLEQLAGNLLTNAVRHNRRGGTAGVRTAAEGPTAVLEVTSTGPAVEDPERLFEPFQRGEHADVPGAGLGLSIVRAVARTHGGDAVATARPGGGLTVRVSLATADAPAARSGPSPR